MNIFRQLKSGIAGGILPLLLLSVWALNACGPETPQAVPASVLNRGTGDEPESLDMQKASSTGAGEVQRDIGEGLLGFTPNGELRAAAARRWTISDDGREYTFWLRPEARWSNGDPVTAEDFVYSFRRLVDPTTAALYIKSVDAVENANEIMAGQLMPDALGVRAIGEHGPAPRGGRDGEAVCWGQDDGGAHDGATLGGRVCTVATDGVPAACVAFTPRRRYG